MRVAIATSWDRKALARALHRAATGPVPHRLSLGLEGDSASWHACCLMGVLTLGAGQRMLDFLARVEDMGVDFSSLFNRSFPRVEVCGYVS